MSVRLPEGWQVVPLSKLHNRAAFKSGESDVDDWLRSKARQSQDKKLSSTRVVLDETGAIAGFYTLAFGQVRADQLPHEVARKLPNELLPIITLAWMGRDQRYAGSGLGEKLLALALNDCLHVSSYVRFVAVVLDCLNEHAKRFYMKFDFMKFPEHPMKLLLPLKSVESFLQS